MSLEGFPILAQLNQKRVDLFEEAHRGGSKTVYLPSWLGHKALTVIALPANLVGVGIGVLGMVATASTFGALKVAIYAATVGNVKIDNQKYPTGFVWCARRGLNAGGHLVYNLGELIYDAGKSVYLSYRFVRWVGRKLHLDALFQAIFRRLHQLFEFMVNHVVIPVCRFVGRRLNEGIEKAKKHESEVDFSGKTPAFIQPLDRLTEEHRINLSKQERSWSNIFKHYAFSFANIPVNATTAVCAGSASVILGSAFVGKVVLFAATNIDIPVPTFAGQAMNMTFATTANVLIDTGNNIADSFLLIYKTSRVLGIQKVMATALQILLYIPSAFFS